MLYRDISWVRISGLRGNLYLQKAVEAEGVSVQIEGPYEVRVVDGALLMISPEDQVSPEDQQPRFPQESRSEPQSPRRSRTDIVIGQTSIGSVDLAATVGFLSDLLPRTTARTPARPQDAVRITAPPGTRFKLTECYGKRHGPHGWHPMHGSDRFHID